MKKDAAIYGFDVLGITNTEVIHDSSKHLVDFLRLGRHGDMEWMVETASRRFSAKHLWPECQSAILLGISYAPPHNPLQRVSQSQKGVIASYAKGRDYHRVIKGRLKQIAERFSSRSGNDVKVFVDTAPLMEKPLAVAAGIGWQGKHTNLVSREFGSWLLLGCILTTANLHHSNPHNDCCGNCKKCLDICPTNAFPAPYQLDARRCIAYLTIEYKGHIPIEFREDIGNRIFGCDDCLAVCPWNKFAAAAQEAKLKASLDTDDPELAELVDMTEFGFRKRFSGTTIRRTGYHRFMRNVLIAIGNSKNRAFVKSTSYHLHNNSPQVRAMAIWALRNLLEYNELNQLSKSYFFIEKDQYVRNEWILALNFR
ncbi:MAG TPA: Epoxyqueuosine reductase [Hyphomicrobiaceae bacterium MAG_BT-2024]